MVADKNSVLFERKLFIIKRAHLTALRKIVLHQICNRVYDQILFTSAADSFTRLARPLA